MTSVDVAAQQRRINELALQDVDSLAEQQRQCAAELKALPDAIKAAAKAAEYKEAARLQERVDPLNRSAQELAAARAMSVRAKRRRAPAALLPADAVKSQAASAFGDRVAEVTEYSGIPTPLAPVALRWADTGLPRWRRTTRGGRGSRARSPSSPRRRRTSGAPS